MRQFRPFGAAALYCLTAACASHAPAIDLGPLISDRPDFTESAAVIAPRHLQLEGGYTHSRSGDAHANTVGETLARIGVVSRVELRVATNSYHVGRVQGEPVRGMDDASLGAKLRLADGADRFIPWRPEAALIVASSLPTGGRSLTAGRAQPEAKLVLAWSLSERFSLATNLNHGMPVDEAGRYHQWSWSGSLATTLSERLGAYAEWFGFRPDGRDEGHEQFLNGGVTVALRDHLQLDVRAGQGVRGPRQSFVGVGLVRRW